MSVHNRTDSPSIFLATHSISNMDTDHDDTIMREEKSDPVFIAHVDLLARSTQINGQTPYLFQATPLTPAHQQASGNPWHCAAINTLRALFPNTDLPN